MCRYAHLGESIEMFGMELSEDRCCVEAVYEECGAALALDEEVEELEAAWVSLGNDKDPVVSTDRRIRS